MIASFTPWAKPVLRWAGSKRRLLSSLVRFVPETYRAYVEPFAGSACLFFAVRPDRAVLADVNPDLIRTYVAIRDDPDAVVRALRDLGGPDRYYEVRASEPAESDEPWNAARFIYLNRYCFNGVYRINRRGKFNVPLGTRMGPMPTNAEIIRCSEALANARLLADDFGATLSAVRRDDFVYLDPPYPSSRKGYGEYGYDRKFTTIDEPRLITELERLDTIGATFLLSYSCSPEFLGKLRWASTIVSLHESISADRRFRSTRYEVIVTNGRG